MGCAMNRIEFHRLAELRLEEAKALLAARFPEGAYYLAGYAVERALKACIARKTQEHDFPDKKLVDKSYTHDVGKLIDAAGLSLLLSAAISENAGMEPNWNNVREWSEQSRYDLFDGSRAESMKEAQMLILAIESAHDGVLQWIKKHW
jgi:hypothetical protein